MPESIDTVLADILFSKKKNKQKLKASADIRVSPNSYFLTFFLCSFFSGFLLYIDRDAPAVAIFITSAIIIPILAWNDRIIFDGKYIYRTGIFPNLWAQLHGVRRKLKPSQVEQIESQALRALKRGGNVFYRFKTTVNGKGMRFVFASGGEDYREMVTRIFSLVPIDTLDNRSIELRDYLTDPKETLMKAEFAKIPSMEVLENSVNEFKTPNRHLRSKPNRVFSETDKERAIYLRQLANELRMSGNLLQALEAFRRTLLLDPKNPWLLFEYARCLHSYAGLERNGKLTSRANAVLRLAEIRAGSDSELLARIAESYFQYGNWSRAAKVFNQVLGIAKENFRAVRGLAEIALREGKIAHVIHHFSSAAYYAEGKALKRWANVENAYFCCLNNSEEYMEAEIKRINRLESVEKKKRTFLKGVLLSLLLVFLGILFDPIVAELGWIISFATISMWVISIMIQAILSERSSFFQNED